MDLVEECFEPILELLLLGTLIEFANEMAAGSEDIKAEA
jgi:hypothetical protein